MGDDQVNISSIEIDSRKPLDDTYNSFNSFPSTNTCTTTKNGLLIEFQNTLSTVCYEAFKDKEMKQEDVIIGMQNNLFSNAEQLIRGEGPFANLFERVPVESYGTNSSNDVRYRLKIKPILLGDDTNTWYMDLFTKEMLCSSSINCSQKIAPRTFHYSRYKITEKNCKKMSAKFSSLLNNKQEYDPSTENESGKTYDDYFVSTLADTLPEINPNENLKGYPLISGAMAFYLFSPFSRYPTLRLTCLGISTSNAAIKRARKVENKNKDGARSNNASGDRKLSKNDITKRRKLNTQDEMIKVHNNRIITGRRNTYIITLARRIDSAILNVKNTFEMARACEPNPNENNPIWKLYYDAVNELNDLKEKQKVVDEEEREFHLKVSKGNIINLTLDDEKTTEEKE